MTSGTSGTETDEELCTDSTPLRRSCRHSPPTANMAAEGSLLLDDPKKVSGKAWGRVGKFAACNSNYPKSVFFILGNEFCERFSFYGMKAILVIYLTQWLRFGENTATALFHTFSAVCYFTPILGAILADGFIGKFKTILYLSMIYALGNIMMSLTALPPSEWFGPLAALFLIGIGTGGIKPCVAAFGGDQFSSNQTKELTQFFSVFYFAINLGSVFSMILTPILRSDIKCFGSDCYPVAFGVPALLMITSLIIFFCGRSQYKIYPPTGNVIGKMCRCITHAIANKVRFHRSDPKDHWLDYANDTFEQPFLEDVKAVMRVLFLFIPLPFFWTLFDQQGVFGYLKPDQMQALNAILIIVLIPVFESIIYPLLDKCKIPNRPIQRMTAGMLLAAVAFVVAGFLDIHIQATQPTPLGNDQCSVKFINSAPCPVYIQSPVLNGSIHVSHGSDAFKLPPGEYAMSFHATETNHTTCDELQAGPDTNLHVVTTPQSAYHVVLMEYQQTLIARQLNYTAQKARRGGGLVSFILASEDVTGNDEATLKRTSGLKYLFNLTELESTPFTEVEPGSYEVYLTTGANRTVMLSNTLLIESGGVYTVVIQHNVSNHRAYEMVDYTDEIPNKVPMWHQVPQYFLMTAGEILFSVTGLSFAYTQAPASMKSVLQAAWLMTVAVGNIIVIIAAEVRMTDNQAIEFFIFAGLMAIDACVFAMMGYFYVYIKQERDYNELEPDQDTLVSEAESHVLDMKTPEPGETEAGLPPPS